MNYVMMTDEKMQTVCRVRAQLREKYVKLGPQKYV